MEVRTLKAAAAPLFQQGSIVFITTFSLFPATLRDLVGRANFSTCEVHVLFQNWSYSPMNPDKKQRLLQQEAMRKELADLRVNVYQYKYQRKDPMQMHLKTITSLDRQGRMRFLQFSYNLNPHRLHVGNDDRELLYNGIPANLETLLDMMRAVLLDRNAVPPVLVVSSTPAAGANANANISPEERARRRLREMSTALRQPANRPSKLAYLVCGAPKTGRLLESLHTHLTDATTNAIPDALYDGNPGRATQLVMHFAFVSVSMQTTVCTSIVAPFCISDAELRASAVLAFPEELRDMIHEKFVARVTDGKIQWFFLCSSNMTRPSWGRLANNFESGILLFEHRDQQRRSFPPDGVVWQRLKWATSPAENNVVLPVRCTAQKVRREQLAPIVAPPGVEEGEEEQKQNHEPEVVLWDVFMRDTRSLFEGLDRLAGADDLLRLVGKDMRLAFSLYYILFDQLGGQHDHRDLHPDAVAASFESSLQHMRRPPAWAADAAVLHTVMHTLVDLFCRWAVTFDMFDGRIMAKRIRITPETLRCITDLRPNDRLLEHHGRRALPRTPYDALTFLLQNAASGVETWWSCDQGHSFYLPVVTMMSSSPNPSCIVCAKSKEVRLLVDELKKYDDVSLVTVEFPLFRRGTRSDPNIRYCRSTTHYEEPCPDRAKGKQQLFYDIFFVFKGQLCAIEYDDPSHLRGPLPDHVIPPMLSSDYARRAPRAPHRRGQPQPRQRQDDAESEEEEEAGGARPKRKAVHPDAVKNVLSSILGIHLARLFAPSKRANAPPRLRQTLDDFLRRVEQSTVDTRVYHQSRQGGFHLQTYYDYIMPRLQEAVKLEKLTAHSLLDTNPDRPDQLQWPVSVVYKIDDTALKTTEEMMQSGADTHPAFKDDMPVALCQHFNAEAACLNSSNMLQYVISQTPSNRFDFLGGLRSGSLAGHVFRVGAEDHVVVKCDPKQSGFDITSRLLGNHLLPDTEYVGVEDNMALLGKALTRARDSVIRLYPPIGGGGGTVLELPEGLEYTQGDDLQPSRALRTFLREVGDGQGGRRGKRAQARQVRVRADAFPTTPAHVAVGKRVYYQNEPWTVARHYAHRNNFYIELRDGGDVEHVSMARWDRISATQRDGTTRRR